MLQTGELQVLIGLGLTPLQAKVYAAIISLENPTANAIAEVSKVARQEIYRITKELSEMGLVSKVIATPTKFKSLSLTEGLSFLLERRNEKTCKLQTDVRKILKRKINKGATTGHRVYEFIMVPEKAPWFKNIGVDFWKCRTFDLLTSIRRFSSRMSADEELYSKAVKRGMKIRVLTEEPPNNSPILTAINTLKKHPRFEVRYMNTSPPVVLIIMDKKKAALAISPSKCVGPPYLVSNHPSFVYMTQRYFETIWNETSST
jgi:DNA-binding MarR family transcriptional regulator